MRSNETLSIITFNVLGTPYAVYKSPTSHLLPRYRKQRFAIIADELNRSDADIICLQEVHSYLLLRFFRTKLTNYPYLAYEKFLYGPKGGLVTFSKRPIEQTDYVTYHKKGSIFNKSFVAKVSRKGILLSKLKDVPVQILNTHLTANIDWDWSEKNKFMPYITAQLDQLAKFLNTLAKKKNDIIIAGDFNMPKGSKYYQEFLSKVALTDIFKQTDLPTYHEEHLPPGKASERIDYIFHLKNHFLIELQAAEHLFDKKVTLPNGVRTFLSDHVGLKVKLKFLPQKE